MKNQELQNLVQLEIKNRESVSNIIGMNNKTIKICDECESSETSKMINICPNCSHYLYGYKNCNHQFENGRCVKCYLDEKIYKK